MVSVVITGVCSTLAQAVLKQLTEDNRIESITGVDIQQYTGPFADRVDFVREDVRNNGALVKTFSDADADVLIHAAFIVVTDVPDHETIYDINVNGSKSVFDAAITSGIRTIIFLSSVAAYGAFKEPVKDNLVTETTPLLGCTSKKWWYGYSKCKVEQYLDYLEKKHQDLRTIRLRPHIISGPFFIKNTSNISVYAGQIVSNRKTVWGIKPKNSANLGVQLSHENDIAEIIHHSIFHTEFHGAFNVVGKPLDLGRYAAKFGKKFKRIPWWLAVYVPKLFIPFSSRLRKFSSWLDAVKIAYKVQSERLSEQGYTKNLQSTEEIMDEAVDLMESLRCI